MKLRAYYDLAKPGIIYGNLISLLSGYALAARSSWHLEPLFFSALGLSLIIGAACVLNNIWDRDIDAKMERTKKRAMAVGEIATTHALIYAAILFIAGAVVLGAFVTYIALAVAFVGFVVYIPVYSHLKRYTPFAAHVGAIAGATPIVVGYSAAHSLDFAAAILFIIMFVWQMPHFFAISIYRKEEYAAAGVPVWSVRYGTRSAIVHLVAYVALYVLAIFSLYLSGYANTYYLAIMGPLSLWWLVYGLKGFTAQNENKWAKTMFVYSLILVLALCGALMLQR